MLVCSARDFDVKIAILGEARHTQGLALPQVLYTWVRFWPLAHEPRGLSQTDTKIIVVIQAVQINSVKMVRFEKIIILGEINFMIFFSALNRSYFCLKRER